VPLDADQQSLAARQAPERALVATRLVQQSEENLHLVEDRDAPGGKTAFDTSKTQRTRFTAPIAGIHTQYDCARVLFSG
jgi:outer membrane protein TolC